jgi:hypothetical protein
MRFFVTGDEWALVDIVPRENLAQFDRVRAQYSEHHKDTDFGPFGWTTPPFLIPAPQVSIAVRKIPLARLAELFTGVLVRADLVETCVDFTGAPFEAKRCYAWGRPPEFRAGVYGDATDEVVQSMHIAEEWFDEQGARDLSDRLALLGSEHRLLLVGHGSTIIDLEDRERMVTFLAGQGVI